MLKSKHLMALSYLCLGVSNLLVGFYWMQHSMHSLSMSIFGFGQACIGMAWLWLTSVATIYKEK